MATYGSFPGVRVTTESGGISAIAIGSEEKVVIFGESSYGYDTSNDEIIVEGDDANLDVKANEPEQIAARRQANEKFGDGSELAEGMKEALQNGANINFLYGVAVARDFVEGETSGESGDYTTQTGTLANKSIVEHTGVAVDSGSDSLNDFGIEVYDDAALSTELNIELRYDEDLVTNTNLHPTSSDTIFINPLTGEWAADSAPDGTNYEFSYSFNDYSTAFNAGDVTNIVDENETGIFVALSDSDSVSSSLDGAISTLRTNYQLVNGLTIAEPNSSTLRADDRTNDSNGGADAKYDAADYSNANQSVSSEYFYKFAPGREEDVTKTIAGGIGGLFAGNPIDDPIYNDQLSGYQSLEEKLTKQDSDNLRDENINPIRSGGTIRVQGNRATNFTSSDTVAAEFFTRRITDRVILIAKQVGDNILGRINDEETRNAAERAINGEMRQLVNDRLIRSNEEEENWNVDVYEDETNRNEVNIDVTFTPFGIVKRVDETITVVTN